MRAWWRKRWAIRYYAPDGEQYGEILCRTEGAAGRLMAWHRTLCPSTFRNGWSAHIERTDAM